MVDRQQTVIELTGDPELDEEPARTIGDAFASTPMVRTMVAAVATLITGIFKVAVIDDATIDAAATLVTGLGIVATWIMAQWEARQRAKAQAEATRGAVFAPATVAEIAEDLNPGTTITRYR